ncbi:MAG: hypothetical protein H6Q93_627, partial [Nitrospirae bacterium]|nr:hypothetical protein [Nitrospirota bacterium]
ENISLILCGFLISMKAVRGYNPSLKGYPAPNNFIDKRSSE